MTLPDPAPESRIDTDLFISHASADDPAVSLIDSALNAAGLTTWVDHEHGLSYGDRWQQAISDATLRCRAALFILTPASSRSIWCERELTRIQEHLKRQIFVLKLTAMHDWQIPMIVNNVQYADFTAAPVTDPADPRLSSLVAALQGKGKFDKTLTSTRRTARVTGNYPFGDLLYTLYGRDTDLSTVLNWLTPTDRHVPVCMLRGIGGVGKTRLAVEIVDRLDLPNGAIWFAFDSAQPTEANSPDRLADLIRTHFNLPAGTSDAAWSALNGRDTLVVLDNAEDCPASQREGFARRLKSLQSGPRVLITSRHAWDELDFCPERDLHAPSPADGVKILTRMAEVRDYTAKLAGHADQLAQAARYHPRLMLYAVGWLKANPPQAVIKALETLKGKEVEKALAEMVGRTLDQMTAQEGSEPLAALRRLNVTRGGFDYEAAEALLADQSAADPLLSVLTTLAAWNLIEFDGSRYNIDPLVVRTAGEDDGARAIHCDHFLMRAKRQHERQDYAALEPDAANLEAAFQWTISRQVADQAIELAQYGGQFLLNRGRIQQKFDWAQQALILTDKQKNSEGSSGISGRSWKNTVIFRILLRPLKRLLSRSELWARAQNNLGNAYSDLSQVEERTDNLRRAIHAYQAALIYRTPATAPLDYAMTQNNLATAYSDLSEVEEWTDNLRRAIHAYQAALIYYTPTVAPLHYAMTQNNLGNAYRDLSEVEERTDNLRRAIHAYQAALTYSTPTTAPLEYARTQNNLGNAYRDLSEVEERTDNLRRAIHAYQAALIYRTPATAPLDYAMTQNNLGVAYSNLSEVEERADNLRRAIQAYQAALTYRTPTAAPLEYAQTQRNLGNALWNMDSHADACACWHEAERYCRQMGMLDWANWMADQMREKGC
ncbi:MAG: tetratricopeptide repeat protein [Anaerolineae bacterium]|nr:tetratricopeptide repeat protein [Anaerolineae bacterium]